MADGVTLDIEDVRIIATFDGLPSAIRAALLAKCGALALQLEAKIKGKLSGDVLNVQTGALRRSIFSDVRVDGDAVHAEAGSSGDVKYAAFWEFGYVGTEHVREYVREGHKRALDAVLGTKGEILRAAREVDVTGVVRAHDRTINQAPRSFIRSSFAEMGDDIVQGLQDVVKDAVAR